MNLSGHLRCGYTVHGIRSVCVCMCVSFPTEAEQRSEVVPVSLHPDPDNNLSHPLHPSPQAQTQLRAVRCKTLSANQTALLRHRVHNCLQFQYQHLSQDCTCTVCCGDQCYFEVAAIKKKYM